MNVFNRASKYLTKKKSKSLIILFLFVIVATANLIIVNLDSTISSYYKQMSESTSNEVVLNRQMNMSGGKPSFGSEGLSSDDIEKITSLDYVTGSKQSSTLRVSSDLELVTIDSSDTESATKDSNAPQMTVGDASQQSVVASSDLALESDIADGTVKSDGNVQDLGENEIMISEAFAKLNDLEVGDKVKLTVSDRRTEEETSHTYKVGQIYTYSGDYDNAEMGLVPDNTIYMNLDAASKLSSEGAGAFSKVSFFIDSVDDYEKLKTDVFSKLDITEEDYSLDLNDETYTTIIKPLETAVSSLKTAKNAIMIIALVIIAIFISLALKERMYEVSVYYSLGASKTNIISQFILENLILYTIATVIAIALSVLLTNVVLDSSLVTGFSQQAGEMATRGGGAMMKAGGPGQAPGTAAVSTDITLSISALKIMINYVITAIVIMALNLALLLKVLRKNPREIMMDK